MTLISDDEYFPKEKYVTLFKAEWEDKYAKFDDYFINFFQYFHLKKEDDGILNKVIGFIFMLLAYGMTCKFFHYQNHISSHSD